MPKFTLIAEHTDDYGDVTSRATREFDEEFLPEVIMNLDMFLRGTGFCYSGKLGISEPETYSTFDGPSSTAFDDQFAPAPAKHSDFYFDINRKPMSSGRDVYLEKWHEEHKTDTVCEYAETALEHYMKENAQLKEKNKNLKEYVKQLLWRAQEHD